MQQTPSQRTGGKNPRLTSSVDPDLYKRTVEAAEAEGRTVSNFVKRAIEVYIRRIEEEPPHYGPPPKPQDP